MNNKEFEDFFKGLENNNNSAQQQPDDDEFVFSSFFNDNAQRNKDGAEQPTKSRTPLNFDDDDAFSPPPPSEEDAFSPPPPSDEDEDEEETEAPKKVPQKKSEGSEREKLFGGIFAKHEKEKEENIREMPDKEYYDDYSDEETVGEIQSERKKKTLINCLSATNKDIPSRQPRR